MGEDTLRGTLFVCAAGCPGGPASRCLLRRGASTAFPAFVHVSHPVTFAVAPRCATLYTVSAAACVRSPSSLRGCASDVFPSFVLMAIQDEKVVTYVYELHGADMRVTKTEFTKGDRRREVAAAAAGL
jgi:hypothetical protein